jgi:peptide/nickel transport system ATP-binding protein
MSAPLLAIERLTVDLPPGADRAHAVEDVSLELNREEILCLVGESGSGKSVTARAVLDLLPKPRVRPSAGRVLFEGRDLLQLDREAMRAIRGRRISMIFQEPMSALNPLMTIGRQIEEVIERHGEGNRRMRHERIVASLEDVGLPEPARIARAYPHQLSGGQRQRAMIAMALVMEPAVLLADEPTTALDVTTQAQILALIRRLMAAHHTGVMFITHDFGVVAEIADRVAVMQEGRVVESGTVDKVLGAPQHRYTRELIAAVPGLTPKRARRTAAGRNLLKLERLSKTFTSGWLRHRRTVHAARDVSLAIEAGETVGLVGESGSGKSTVARLVTRLVEPDRGRIEFNGIDLVPLARSAMRPHRKRMQIVFQDPYGSLNPRRRVAQIIAEGPIVHGVAPAQAFRRAYELLELVGLDAKAGERFPHEFSGGQRQRIGIARALAVQPQLLIADEPVSALDVSVQAQVLRLLADIRERFHLAMLFITHDLRVAAEVCDTIAVMRHGEVVEYGATVDVFREPRHAYTRDLLGAVPGRNRI